MKFVFDDLRSRTEEEIVDLTTLNLTNFTLEFPFLEKMDDKDSITRQRRAGRSITSRELIGVHILSVTREERISKSNEEGRIERVNQFSNGSSYTILMQWVPVNQSPVIVLCD